MILKGQRNQCAACSLYFRSNAAFDKHRTGTFGKDRRCKTVEEMMEAGMVQNVSGWWVGSVNTMFANKDNEDELDGVGTSD